MRRTVVNKCKRRQEKVLHIITCYTKVLLTAKLIISIPVFIWGWRTTPLSTSFRRMFFVYHHAMKHYHTNIINTVSLFSIPFDLKLPQTIENRFINKKLYIYKSSNRYDNNDKKFFIF